MQNNNNNGGQGHQVPDHRLSEMQEQLRRSNEENSRLRGMVDQIAQQQQAMLAGQQNQQQPQQPQFTPDIDQALSNKFQQMFKPHVEQFRQTIGGLADQNDLLGFQVKFGGDTLDKYTDKIERIRNERARVGQYISREDAYRHIFFEENGRKPKENPVVQNQSQQPTFDPYTGMMILPPTPAPATQTATPAQPAPAQAAAPVQQQGFVQQQNQNVQQPIANLETQTPVLPPSSMNPAGGTQVAPVRGGTQLDIASDGQALDAWAAKHGDISL